MGGDLEYADEVTLGRRSPVAESSRNPLEFSGPQNPNSGALIQVAEKDQPQQSDPPTQRTPWARSMSWSADRGARRAHQHRGDEVRRYVGS